MSLEDLLKRVESCSGPDRALDLSICEALGQPQGWSGDLHGLGSAHYTSSLDAALALVEEKLPDRVWARELDGMIYLWPTGACRKPAVTQRPLCGDALTLIAALLRALISQKEGVE